MRSVPAMYAQTTPHVASALRAALLMHVATRSFTRTKIGATTPAPAAITMPHDDAAGAARVQRS